MTEAVEEFERDVRIANRSNTLADIAEQLLSEDAGAALIQAALVIWERQHGRAAALQLARTALIRVGEQDGKLSSQQN